MGVVLYYSWTFSDLLALIITDVGMFLYIQSRILYCIIWNRDIPRIFLCWGFTYMRSA